MTAQTAVRLFITDPPATAADPVPAKPGVFQIAGTRFCRECGCTDFDACVHAEHGACWWVEPDLCSHCKFGWGDQNGG